MERHSSNASHRHSPRRTCLHLLAEVSLSPQPPQYDIARRQMHNGGGIVCFELKGGLESGRNFLNNLKMLSLTANLGDTRSIASHPASTTHAKLTLKKGQPQASATASSESPSDSEHRDDILQDILQAF